MLGQVMRNRSDDELPDAAEPSCPDHEQIGILAGLYQATRRNVSHQPSTTVTS